MNPEDHKEQDKNYVREIVFYENRDWLFIVETKNDISKGFIIISNKGGDRRVELLKKLKMFEVGSFITKTSGDNLRFLQIVEKVALPQEENLKCMVWQFSANRKRMLKTEPFLPRSGSVACFLRK